MLLIVSSILYQERLNGIKHWLKRMSCSEASSLFILSLLTVATKRLLIQNTLNDSVSHELNCNHHVDTSFMHFNVAIILDVAG
mmetsp:Transcript_35463/g.56987  ORF Transcript_35463/g.56987 Transcript_35463/m.56987 type:complete len:83 (+) Transcript_35463:378-626(+)